MSNLMIQVNNKMMMSSREIAELVESRHPDVCTSIERLMKAGAIGGYTAIPYTHPQNGQEYKHYLIGKRDSYVVVAQLSPTFTARLVDRWQELEEQVQKPKTALELAREQVMLLEHIEQQKLLIEQQAPKVAALDRIASSVGSLCLSDAAKILNQPPHAFNRWLNRIEWIFKRTAGDNWTGYADKIKAGYLEMTAYTQRRLGDDTEEQTFKQVKITPKGLTKLSQMLSVGGAV